MLYSRKITPLQNRVLNSLFALLSNFRTVNVTFALDDLRRRFYPWQILSVVVCERTNNINNIKTIYGVNKNSLESLHFYRSTSVGFHHRSYDVPGSIVLCSLDLIWMFIVGSVRIRKIRLNKYADIFLILSSFVKRRHPQ